MRTQSNLHFIRIHIISFPQSFANQTVHCCKQRFYNNIIINVLLMHTNIRCCRSGSTFDTSINYVHFMICIMNVAGRTVTHMQRINFTFCKIQKILVYPLTFVFMCTHVIRECVDWKIIIIRVTNHTSFAHIYICHSRRQADVQNHARNEQ